MTVDTRYRPRAELEIEVLIVHRKRCIRARSKNISSGGIFLVATAMTIPPGTFVELEFEVDKSAWQIDGLVIRQDEEGIVCLFRMPQPELLKTAINYQKSLESTSSGKAPAAQSVLNSALLLHPNSHF